MAKTHRPLVVAALMMSLFMAAMEVTVVSTAMPTVIADLGGLELYAWVFTAYMLSSTVTVPIYGKLADLYGRKPIILFGIAVFLVGSMASGQARTMDELIAFRALQGLGAGAMQPIALTIVGDIFSIEERGRMQGLFGAVWGVAGLSGPMLGGLIVKAIGWRWVFYINIPSGILSALLLSVALVENIEKKKHKLDVLGALLLASGLIVLLASGRGSSFWLSLLVGLALLAAFIAVERRTAEPLLPLDLFRMRFMSVASIAGALVGGAMVSTTTYIPLFVQGVLGGSPTDAGGAITPMVVGWPIASALGGRFLTRIGFRPLIVLGFLIAASASLLFAVLVGPSSTLTLPHITTAAFGVGLGFANTALLIGVQSSVSWQQRGVATASTMFFRSIGGALAVGFTGRILADGIAGASSGSSELASSLLGPEHGQGLAPDLLHELSFALQSSLGTIFWVIAGLALSAFAVSLAIPELKGKESAEAEPQRA